MPSSILNDEETVAAWAEFRKSFGGCEGLAAVVIAKQIAPDEQKAPAEFGMDRAAELDSLSEL